MTGRGLFVPQAISLGVRQWCDVRRRCGSRDGGRVVFGGDGGGWWSKRVFPIGANGRENSGCPAWAGFVVNAFCCGVNPLLGICSIPVGTDR